MRHALLLAAVALLAGCALSPQTIHVTPTLAVTAENVGQGRSLAVRVEDLRADAAIGSRGGVYAKSSLIRPENDVAAAVRAEFAKALGAQGYVVDANAPVSVTVGIEQLSYVVPAGAVTTGADISAALRITAERGDTRHTATYRSTITRKFPVAPSATQNETWVNEVLSDTLVRFFSDAQMRAFLAQ